MVFFFPHITCRARCLNPLKYHKYIPSCFKSLESVTNLVNYYFCYEKCYEECINWIMVFILLLFFFFFFYVYYVVRFINLNIYIGTQVQARRHVTVINNYLYAWYMRLSYIENHLTEVHNGQKFQNGNSETQLDAKEVFLMCYISLIYFI